MTQRQLTGSLMPDCGAGHAARHMLDGRSKASGGGHFIECQCRQTTRHDSFEDALDAWHDINGMKRAKRLPAQPQLPLNRVTHLRLNR